MPDLHRCQWVRSCSCSSSSIIPSDCSVERMVQFLVVAFANDAALGHLLWRVRANRRLNFLAGLGQRVQRRVQVREQAGIGVGEVVTDIRHERQRGGQRPEVTGVRPAARHARDEAFEVVHFGQSGLSSLRGAVALEFRDSVVSASNRSASSSGRRSQSVSFRRPSAHAVSSTVSTSVRFSWPRTERRLNSSRLSTATASSSIYSRGSYRVR